MAESATKVKMTSSFEVLCIQYHSDIDGIHNIAALTKWNDWEQKYQIVDDVETPKFGVIDGRVLDVVTHNFFQYGSVIFEDMGYADDEIQEMFDEYVTNCFTDETVTFCEWTRTTVYVKLEVSV